MSSHRVVLTREPADNAALRHALGVLDVDVTDYPCIAIEPLPIPSLIRERLARRLYGTAIFVSRNGVASLLSQLFARPPARVIALGTGTQQSLLEHGWPVTGRPSTALASVLAEELDGLVHDEGPVLYVRALIGSRVVPEKLRSLGREVDEVLAYRTIDPVTAPLTLDDRPALFAFASPSAIRHFLAHNPLPALATALCIGPTTAGAAREAGFVDVRETSGSEDEAFADAIRRWRAT